MTGILGTRSAVQIHLTERRVEGGLTSGSFYHDGIHTKHHRGDREGDSGMTCSLLNVEQSCDRPTQRKGVIGQFKERKKEGV